MPSKPTKKSNQSKSSLKPSKEDLKKNQNKGWTLENKADRDYDESIESPRTRNRR